jgi:FkbM family methyltransferase
MRSANLGTIRKRPKPLAVDDCPFRHYSLKHRAIAWISRHLFDHITYTARHGLIRGMRRKGGLGWIPAFLARAAQTKEEMFWRGLPLAGLVVYDIGAFHGLLTMFFASRCGKVIAYEPNDANRSRLAENIALNKLINVDARRYGLGAQPGLGTLHYDPAMAGGGSLHPLAIAPSAQTIEITTLDRDIAAHALPVPHLIKIDVEGWELATLQGAHATLALHHPALFLEMHGETMREKQRKAREIVNFLHEAGYRSIQHVESGSAITADNVAAAAEGHLYCLYTACRSIECPTNTWSLPLKVSSA